MTIIPLEQILDDIVKAPKYKAKAKDLEAKAFKLAKKYELTPGPSMGERLKGVGKSLKRAYYRAHYKVKWSCHDIKPNVKSLVRSLDEKIDKHMKYPSYLYKRKAAIAFAYGVSALCLAYFNQSLLIVDNLTDLVGFFLKNPNFAMDAKEMAPSIGAFVTTVMSNGIYDDDVRGFVQALCIGTIAYNCGLQITDAIPGLDKYVDTLSYATVLGSCVATVHKGLRLKA